jgi:glucosylceramidase
MKVTELFETAKDTAERLASVAPQERLVCKDKMLSCIISVTPSETHQTFLGFGGAATESSGYVLSKLPPVIRDEAIKSYFIDNNYRFARTHMNSCDFSLENWACVPQKDETLGTFSMERTDRYLTPLLKAANECTGGKLNVLLSTWSPPAWMKDNNDMNHGGHLLPQYRQLWATYFVTFIHELNKRGLSVPYLTIQNEPAAVQPWDSCEWSAEDEGHFAAELLGPALKEAGLSTQILIWDHNRDLLAQRFTASLSVPNADKYIAGAAYHWYSGDQYENVRTISEKYPEKQLIFTEGCIEGGPRNGAWFTGERYAHNIINDLNNGCTAWIDWNIVLDMQGGPNHANNFCDSPILADTQTGTLNYQSSFYYIGHFSRFIHPYAKRISTKIESWMTPANVDGRIGNTMETSAFHNEDGTIALVVTNRTEADMIYKLDIADGTKPTSSVQSYAAHADLQNDSGKLFVCPPRAIQTLILK